MNHRKRNFRPSSSARQPDPASGLLFSKNFPKAVQQIWPELRPNFQPNLHAFFTGAGLMNEQHQNPPISAIRSGRLTSEQTEYLEGQLIACKVLLRACQDATFDFSLSSTYATDSREERLNETATLVLSNVLHSWREAAAFLKDLLVLQVWPDEVTLARWMQADSSLTPTASAASRRNNWM